MLFVLCGIPFNLCQDEEVVPAVGRGPILPYPVPLCPILLYHILSQPTLYGPMGPFRAQKGSKAVKHDMFW